MRPRALFPIQSIGSHPMMPAPEVTVLSVGLTACQDSIWLYSVCQCEVKSQGVVCGFHPQVASPRTPVGFTSPFVTRRLALTSHTRRHPPTSSPPVGSPDSSLGGSPFATRRLPLTPCHRGNPAAGTQPNSSPTAARSDSNSCCLSLGPLPALGVHVAPPQADGDTASKGCPRLETSPALLTPLVPPLAESTTIAGCPPLGASPVVFSPLALPATMAEVLPPLPVHKPGSPAVTPRQYDMFTPVPEPLTCDEAMHSCDPFPDSPPAGLFQLPAAPTATHTPLPVPLTVLMVTPAITNTPSCDRSDVAPPAFPVANGFFDNPPWSVSPVMLPPSGVPFQSETSQSRCSKRKMSELSKSPDEALVSGAASKILSPFVREGRSTKNPFLQAQLNDRKRHRRHLIAACFVAGLQG